VDPESLMSRRLENNKTNESILIVVVIKISVVSYLLNYYLSQSLP
jgi:hypothetical protein